MLKRFGRKKITFKVLLAVALFISITSSRKSKTCQNCYLEIEEKYQQFVNDHKEQIESGQIVVRPLLRVMKTYNAFTIKLYKQINDSRSLVEPSAENISISPLSVSTALNLALIGARGQTAMEIERVLGADLFDFYPIYNTSSFRHLNNEHCEIQFVNQAFADENLSLLPQYLEDIERGLGATIENIDFSNQQAASDVINSWSDNETNGKISEIISPKDINPGATKLVLANAIYFNGKWEKPFREINTQPGMFFPNDETEEFCDMMFQNDDFYYMENDTLQMIELPYDGSSLSMLILLPQKNIESLEDNLTEENLCAWTSQLSEQNVSLMLPRFSFETSYELNDHLSEMGMPTAFGLDADFSGISEDELYISKTLHKTFIEVSEQGTEAAASSAVVMNLKSIFKTPSEIVFNADHPFLFVIRDRASQEIFFIGRVVRVQSC